MCQNLHLNYSHVIWAIGETDISWEVTIEHHQMTHRLGCLLHLNACIIISPQTPGRFAIQQNLYNIREQVTLIQNYNHGC